MKFSRYDRPYDEYAKWHRICPEGTWRTRDPSTFSGFIPDSLLLKTNSVFVMASGSPLASVFVVNLNRVDEPAREIDQEPYILAFDHSTSAASGGFVHHGNWQGRTASPGKDFFEVIAASGIQAHYPLQGMPTASSGYIDDLAADSQRAAFWTAMSALRGTKTNDCLLRRGGRDRLAPIL